MSFDQIRRRSLGGAGQAGGRPRAQGGAGDPGPLSAAGVSCVPGRRGRGFQQGCRRVPGARRPRREGAGRRWRGALPGLQQLEARRGARGSGSLPRSPRLLCHQCWPEADGRKNGAGRVFVPRGGGREGPVPALQAGGAPFRCSVFPPGQETQLSWRKSLPTGPQTPEPGLGAQRHGLRASAQQPGQDRARGELELS